METVVLGAGALGSILAGHLARAGEDVILFARGDRAEYLRQNGITISGLAEFNAPCPIVTEPSQITGADALIVATKTHHLSAAIASLAHAKFSTVFSVLNGVHVNDQLAEVFGASNTLGSAVFFSGEMSPNGDARLTVNSGFSIGELPDGTSDRVQNLAAMLQNSGIKTEAVANILTRQWSKFVVWAAFTPVSILTRLETYKFLSDADCALICTRVLREVAAIADNRGIPLEDSGPFPVEGVVNGSKEEGVATLIELGAFFKSNAPGHRMSALQDLQNGRRLEIDEALGYAVSEAHRLGIPVPALEMCY